MVITQRLPNSGRLEHIPRHPGQDACLTQGLCGQAYIYALVVSQMEITLQATRALVL